jgi:hypothetical protein
MEYDLFRQIDNKKKLQKITDVIFSYFSGKLKENIKVKNLGSEQHICNIFYNVMRLIKINKL